MDIDKQKKKKNRYKRSEGCTFADMQIKINTDSTRIPLVAYAIFADAPVLCESRDTRVFAFYTQHMNHDLAYTYIEDRRSIEIPLPRREKSLCLNSTRLWRGSCCIGYIMNAQLKIVAYIASLYVHYRVPKIRKLVLRASHFIFANKNLSRATSRYVTIIRYLPLCSIISDRLPLHFVFSFSPFNRCTIDSIWKFRSPMMLIVQSDAR